MVDLTWTGAAGDVDLYRDAVLIGTAGSDGDGAGSYTDDIGANGGGSYGYQVCDGGTAVCSDIEQVIF